MSQRCLQGAESQIQHPVDANGHTVVIYQSCGFIYRLERYGSCFFYNASQHLLNQTVIHHRCGG